METGFKNVVSKGKVKASKAKDNEEGTTKKEPKLNGYRMFQKMTRHQVRTMNPDATPQEMMVPLNAQWTKEKSAGRRGLWDSRAAQENNPEVADHAVGMASASITVLGSSNFHAIQRCELCGMMIANLNSHLLLAHRLDNGPGQVDIAEQVLIQTLLVFPSKLMIFYQLMVPGQWEKQLMLTLQFDQKRMPALLMMSSKQMLLNQLVILELLILMLVSGLLIGRLKRVLL